MIDFGRHIEIETIRRQTLAVSPPATFFIYAFGATLTDANLIKSVSGEPEFLAKAPMHFYKNHRRRRYH